MAKIKLTNPRLTPPPQERDYEFRDTTVPGFLLNVTPTGRKIFMLQYRRSTSASPVAPRILSGGYPASTCGA